MLTLKNGRILTPYRMLDSTDIQCSNGKITAVGVDCSPSGGETIDLTDMYVMPGFIDSHVHGGGGCEFWSDDPGEILQGAAFLAQHGTTTLLPSVNYAEQIVLDAATRAKLSAMKQAIQAGRGAELLGLHLEGPFISPQFPMAPNQPLNPALPERCLAFLAEAPPIVKWTMAPEVEGVLPLIQVLLQRGILVSLGHSNAYLEDIYPAYEQGVRHVTHIYSGMSTVRRVNGRRIPGLLEAALELDEITVEIIANNAHLPPELIRFVWQTKGPEHICVVSDSTAASGSADGPTVYRGQHGFIQDGAILNQDKSGFLGSAVTSDEMLRNLIHRAGIPLLDAVRMCSTTPARSLGVGNRKGVLAPGYDADIVVFDQALCLRMVILRGEVFWHQLP